MGVRIHGMTLLDGSLQSGADKSIRIRVCQGYNLKKKNSKKIRCVSDSPESAAHVARITPPRPRALQTAKITRGTLHFGAENRITHSHIDTHTYLLFKYPPPTIHTPRRVTGRTAPPSSAKCAPPRFLAPIFAIEFRNLKKKKFFLIVKTKFYFSSTFYVCCVRWLEKITKSTTIDV